MNWDRIEGNWKQFKGKVKAQWGKLTDDQFDVISGKRDSLAGKIQETYGVGKDATEKQLAAWQKRVKEADPTKGGSVARERCDALFSDTQKKAIV